MPLVCSGMARECCFAATLVRASRRSRSLVLVRDGTSFPTTRATWFAREPAGWWPAIHSSCAFVRLPYIKTASLASVQYIVFLNRSESSVPELVPFPRDLAMQWARQSPVASDDSDEAVVGSLRTLLSAQLLELRYSRLESAVACLEELINDQS